MTDHTVDSDAAPLRSIARSLELLHNTDLWEYVWLAAFSELDGALTELVEAFAADVSGMRSLIEATRGTQLNAALLVYAQRMATFAVRESAPNKLRHGLLALALSSWLPEGDARDVGFFLGPLSDAAGRLGTSEQPFLQAGRLASASVAKAMDAAIPSRGIGGLVARALFWLSSGPAFRPSMTKEGFRYGRPTLTRAEADSRVAKLNAIVDANKKPL